MDLFSEVFDDLNEIQIDAGELTIDQRIRIANTRALLSISQELSSLNPQNTSYTDPDGRPRNGWGLQTHEQ